MNFIETLKQRASLEKKKIVLPEIMDERILKAVEKIIQEDFCEIILIGTDDEVNKAKAIANIEKATIINPKSELTTELIDSLYELRRSKGMTYEEANKLLLTDYMYYACMLVKMGYADGVVSGACHSTANTLRPALQIIKTKPNVDLVSAFFLMKEST